MKDNYGYRIKRAYSKPPEHTILLTQAYGHNTYQINYINVPWWARRQGHGGRMMAVVLADADREKINLTLTIAPFGRIGIDPGYEELTAWYKRLGFVDYNGLYMRSPDWGANNSDKAVVECEEAIRRVAHSG